MELSALYELDAVGAPTVVPTVAPEEKYSLESVDVKAIILSPFKCFELAENSELPDATPIVTLFDGVKLVAPTAVADDSCDEAYAEPAAMVSAITNAIFIIVGRAISSSFQFSKIRT